MASCSALRWWRAIGTCHTRGQRERWHTLVAQSRHKRPACCRQPAARKTVWLSRDIFADIMQTNTVTANNSGTGQPQPDLYAVPSCFADCCTPQRLFVIWSKASCMNKGPCSCSSCCSTRCSCRRQVKLSKGSFHLTSAPKSCPKTSLRLIV